MVERRVVKDQQSGVEFHLAWRLVPQGLRIRLQPVPQARKGIVRWRINAGRLDARRFQGAEGTRRRDEKIDIVLVVTFWWIHACFYSKFRQLRNPYLIEEAERKGEIPAWQMAYLTDRIRVFEGRGQVYGLQFDWDEAGEMSPCEIEDIENVDERRRSVDLPPLAESVRRQRAGAAESNERAPRDWHARQLEMKAWARSVGWRK